MQQKIAEAQTELAELEKLNTATPVDQNAVSSIEENAAAVAIAKAQAKAATLANMSDDEKRAEQIQSLKMRLEKAQERLAKAEAENDANVEAFRTASLTLEEKLNALL